MDPQRGSRARPDAAERRPHRSRHDIPAEPSRNLVPNPHDDVPGPLPGTTATSVNVYLTLVRRSGADRDELLALGYDREGVELALRSLTSLVTVRR